MKPTGRAYQNEDDYWRLRAFLRETFLINGRRELSWHVARLDYWRWHFIENCQTCGPVEQVTSIWEAQEGRRASGPIAAVLHPVSMGEAFLHVHPGFRSEALEEEMLAFAEEHLAARTPDGQRHLSVLANQDDAERQRVLARRGYTRTGQSVRHWRRDLDAPLPEVPPTPGYNIRPLGDVDELPARSWASWRAFHPDEADDQYEGWEWYLNVQSAPLYRRDLDIVAATPAGEIAAFCTIWYDDVTRSAVCVLVGTSPEHQRRGLGKAVLYEGLRRLQEMGGTRAFANGYDPAANALYGAVLGTHDLSESWVKRW
jgi:ribosomal protein S18 acetylase RimI-like enzyme